MSSVSPTSLTRSSLEEMLESLRRKDEDDKPRDSPPALPARPTSRARLPAARRSLPANFNAEIAMAAPTKSLNQSSKKREEVSQAPVLPSVLQELQRRVAKAEATLGQKEQENAALREQLEQVKARWSEYETKMKSVEAMWQKEMVSLQVNLDAVKRSLATDNTAIQPGRVDGFASPHYYDSEETMSMGAQTTGGNTPIKVSHIGRDVGAGREINGGLNAVGHLVKEFEQRKQDFDEEAKAIAVVKSGHPIYELRKLKLRFET